MVESGAPLPMLSTRAAVRRSLQALATLITRTLGTDAAWARTPPRSLERAGLIDCDAEGLAVPVRGGSAMARWLRATTALVRTDTLDSGVIGEEDLDAADAAYADPNLIDYTWLTIAGWGRRGQARASMSLSIHKEEEAWSNASVS